MSCDDTKRFLLSTIIAANTIKTKTLHQYRTIIIRPAKLKFNLMMIEKEKLDYEDPNIKQKLTEAENVLHKFYRRIVMIIISNKCT